MLASIWELIWVSVFYFWFNPLLCLAKQLRWSEHFGSLFHVQGPNESPWSWLWPSSAVSPGTIAGSWFKMEAIRHHMQSSMVSISFTWHTTVAAVGGQIFIVKEYFKLNLDHKTAIPGNACLHFVYNLSNNYKSNS